MTNEEIKKRQESKAKAYETFKQYFNYGIVAVTSLLVLMVAPALESAISGELNYPTTLQGWIFWAIGRVAVTVINLVIFIALDNQSEINAQNNENYQRAKEILDSDPEMQKIAVSPKQKKRKDITGKIPFIILGSAASLVALSQIIFNYSLSTLVSYIFTVVMDIAFAIWHMIDKEVNYWSDEFLRYALQVQNERQIGPKEKNLSQNNINTQQEPKEEEKDGNND